MTHEEIDALKDAVIAAARKSTNCWEHEDNCCHEWCATCRDGRINKRHLREAFRRLDAVLAETNRG